MTPTPCRRCGNALPDDVETCPVCDTPVAAPRSPAAGWEALTDKIQEATGSKYRILRLLGYGGMAGVYLAEEPMLGRRVAIKVMTPGLMMDSDLIDRFHQEARTIARLNHPNIVTIYDIGGTGDLHYFAMTYVPGRTLAQVMTGAGGPLPFDVTRAWLAQMADALGYAHRHDIVHRDIKPGNILLDGDGNVHVTDFGIAKVADAPKMTRTGLIVGTPVYMSPEQCGGERVTGASDQYALGTVAYEMLTGQPPFTGPAITIMHAHIGEEPKPIRDTRRDCPADLEAAVLRMLAKAPVDRWPDTADFIRAIEGRGALNDDRARAEMAAMARPAQRIEIRTTGGDGGIEVGAGESRRLTVRVLGADGDVLDHRRVTWISESPDIVAVEEDGTLVGREPGTARIVAQCEGLTVAAGVRVEDVEIDTLEIMLPEPRLAPGASGIVSARATAAGRDLSRGPIAWTSSDPDVARVSGEGRVEAVGPGTAVITARYRGREASASVVVEGPAPASSAPPRAPATPKPASGPPAGLDADALGIARHGVDGPAIPPTELMPQPTRKPPPPKERPMAPEPKRVPEVKPARPGRKPIWQSAWALGAGGVAVAALIIVVLTSGDGVEPAGAGEDPVAQGPVDNTPTVPPTTPVDSVDGPATPPATPPSAPPAAPPATPPATPPAPVVARLDLQPDRITLEVGQRDTVNVRTLDATGAPVAVASLWRSLDGAVLRVIEQSNGRAVVEALAAGDTRLEVTAGEINGSVQARISAPAPPPLTAEVSGATALSTVDDEADRLVATASFTATTNRPGPWCAAADFDVSGRAVIGGTQSFRAGAADPVRLEFPIAFDALLDDVPQGERQVVARIRVWSADCNEERGPPLRSVEAPPVCMVRFSLRDWQREACR